MAPRVTETDLTLTVHTASEAEAETEAARRLGITREALRMTRPCSWRKGDTGAVEAYTYSKD